MTFSFHPETETEPNKAIEYYEEIQENLGCDFAVEAYSTIERIITYPKVWQVIEDDIRRSLVRRFPFGILYSIELNDIYILAVMHLYREPDYWKDRIGK